MYIISQELQKLSYVPGHRQTAGINDLSRTGRLILQALYNSHQIDQLTPAPPSVKLPYLLPMH